MAWISRKIIGLPLFVCAFCTSFSLYAQHGVLGILPEQRSIPRPDPTSLPKVQIPPDAAAPPTVSQRTDEAPQAQLDLNAAIRQALENADVVRVLAGVGAASSGQTIFDPAIATARIDQQQAIFDPTVGLDSIFLQNEGPFAALRPNPFIGPLITANQNESYDFRLSTTKPLRTGGRFDVQVDVLNEFQSSPGRLAQPSGPTTLNPLSRSSAALSVTQPLLSGAGVDVNMVPIVLARIDAQASYFRLKGAVQESVRGVVQAYWDLVAARTQLWAIDQQVQQADFAVRLETARLRIGTSDQGQFAQAKLALTNFRANRIAAASNVLDREASLRGILGLPPSSPEELIPMSSPATTRYEFEWDKLLELAEQHRPDLIELKLVLEADYQQLLRSKNQALPRLDAVALYRWNGLEGELPNGTVLRSTPGAFTDWQLGINFSVPVGLRAERAAVREVELLIARDRVNLDQARLEIAHEIAASLRQLDQQFSQYEALRETRLAAIENLRQQTAGFRTERIEFINVLQAITDWGSAVSAEARALSQYNAELARLELLTGTILDSHGVRFYEERFRAVAPLGLLHHTACYPGDLRPTASRDRYAEAEQPVDELFREDAPEDLLSRGRDIRVLPRDDLERLPPPPPRAEP